MAKDIKAITLATAGIFQACYLTQLSAKQNRIEEEAFHASINSIFQIDADSVEAIYGGIRSLKTGLEIFLSQFSQQGKPDPELIQYAMNVLAVENMLENDPERMQQIQELIASTKNAIDADYPATHPIILERLAYIYTQNISNLPKRIHIKGDPEFIQNQDNIKRIRATLLAAIRSAVLWQQMGGSKWHLLLFRKKYIACAEDLLKRC